MDTNNPLFRRILLGLGAGAFTAVALVGLGLLGALFAIISGTHIQGFTPNDWRALAYFVASFTVAGAFISGARIHARRRVGIYLGYMLAGAWVFTITGIGVAGWSNLDYWFATVFPALGLLIGAAAAYGHLRYS